MFFLSPAFLQLLLIIIIFLLRSSTKKYLKIFLLVVNLSVFYFTTTPFLYYSVAFPWERIHSDFQQLHHKNSKFKILVLGSGYGHDSELSSTNLLCSSAKSRLLEAVKIADNLPNSQIITSGYSASGKTPGAIVLKNAAIELGIDSSRIFTQTEPHNTKAEAQTFAKKFYSPQDTVILVTSAIHMPRAFQHLKNAGVKNIIPAPCDYTTFKDNTYSFKNFIPKFSYWEKYQKLNKEIVGYYLNL